MQLYIGTQAWAEKGLRQRQDWTADGVSCGFSITSVQSLQQARGKVFRNAISSDSRSSLARQMIVLLVMFRDNNRRQ